MLDLQNLKPETPVELTKEGQARFYQLEGRHFTAIRVIEWHWPLVLIRTTKGEKLINPDFLQLPKRP